MNKKLKIAFMAPETKGGPYYIYKEIVEGLNKKYWNQVEALFFNSKKDWLKLHFTKFDAIFSVIPFLFKPLRTKKFVFNLHWNYKIERKKKWLWVKLLYLVPWNFKFSDKIWLVSKFLANKLWIKDKYKDKIIIIPNFIDTKEYGFWDKKYNNNIYKILTITSFKFYDKGRWIINLWNVIKKLWEKTNKKVIWTIVWNDNSRNFQRIKKEFDKITFPDNVKIIWKWWLDKENIKQELKNNDYFLYWTYLDNFPWVILEAIASKMKVLVNDFESFKYLLPENIICKNENEMVEKILKNSIKKVDIWKFKKENTLKKIYNLITQKRA